MATRAAEKSKDPASNPCWPGYEPVPGVKPHTKGSCKPKPGQQSPAVRKADQRAAAASKLEKAGRKRPKQ